ncbi:hypothetical protein C8Q76DRAFT_110009 [Earliella scabrosa]|nr:hypothetical protein C8Q76DRAFT_110009 [Earliella scabrosa]
MFGFPCIRLCIAARSSALQFTRRPPRPRTHDATDPTLTSDLDATRERRTETWRDGPPCPTHDFHPSAAKWHRSRGRNPECTACRRR